MFLLCKVYYYTKKNSVQKKQENRWLKVKVSENIIQDEK